MYRRPGLMRNCAYGAGTHNPGHLLLEKPLTISLTKFRRGVWVPAFAGTTESTATARR
jgi:hypothetical protein